MKKGLLILALLCVSLGFSQDKQKANTKIATQFQDAYNALDYTAIYNLYSEKRKEEFSLEKTKAFFERIHNSRGQLKTITFVKIENESRHIYKAVFTKRVGELLVTLNKKGKADELSIRSTEIKK